MDEADPDKHESEQAMNLNTLTITPFAQGIIKVDSEEGAFPGTIKTKPSMVVCARHHQAAVARSSPGEAPAGPVDGFGQTAGM